MLTPTVKERDRRSEVLSAIREAIEKDIQIRLPDYDREFSRPAVSSLASVGLEPNPYGGEVGPYRYQFEGEEDLLHLIVSRGDGSPLAAEEGQTVASFLLQGMPPGLIWIRPGELSQHFYCGHDDLLAHVLV